MSTQSADSTLIFLHIPKTAGSTLHSILNKRFSRKSIHNVFAVDYGDEDVRALAALPENRKRQIRLLKGHMPFGLHRYLPQSARYFTMLRDPVKRVVSQYFYIQKNPQNPLYDPIVRGKLGLGEFVSSGISDGMNNGQVRWLAGELHAFGFKEGGRTLLDIARRNIEDHFVLVGLTERFDESMFLLKRNMGWRGYPLYVKENVRRKGTGRNVRISERDLEVVREYNALDIELYEQMARRFDQQIRDAAIEVELESFHRWNRVYQYVRGPLAQLGI